MFSVIRRAFASTAHELGAEIGINSLKSASSGRFFKLEEIFILMLFRRPQKGLSSWIWGPKPNSKRVKFNLLED